MATDPVPPIAADAALRRLLEGNRRFVSQTLAAPNRSAARRLEVATGQAPFAAVLGCADSRMPIEVIFDQGIGDLFVVRVAGNIVTKENAASLEFAVTTFGVPLVLILGHSRCGAVQATVESIRSGVVLPGSLPNLTRAIQPAVMQTLGLPGDPVENAGRANVRLGVDQLTAYDSFLADRIRAGTVCVVGGYYDLETGRVEIITPAPPAGRSGPGDH